MRNHLIAITVGIVIIVGIGVLFLAAKFLGQWMSENLPAEIAGLVYLLAFAWVLGLLIKDLMATPAGGDLA